MIRILVLLLVISVTSKAQSPYLGLKASMAVAPSEHRYKIDMKICEPKKRGGGDVFGRDTSRIDFEALPDSAFSCGKFPEIDKDGAYNYYQFGNQVFTWEKVIVLRIRDWSSAGWQPPMFIVLPIKYKSFVSWVELTDILFERGKVIYLNDIKDTRSGGRLSIKLSLKEYKAIDIEQLPLQIPLEEF